MNRPGAADPAPGAAGGGGPLSVAVIADDPSVRTALRRLLQATGHAVQTFASAEEYLRLPERDRPACLVLDVQLPGASGLDLMRSLAAAGCRVVGWTESPLLGAEGNREFLVHVESPGERR